MEQKLTLGVSNLATDTPPKIKLVYRWLGFFSLVWLAAIEPRFPSIPATVLHAVDSWLAIANFGIYAFCNCFGYKAPDSDDTPAPAPTEIPTIPETKQ